MYGNCHSLIGSFVGAAMFTDGACVGQFLLQLVIHYPYCFFCCVDETEAAEKKESLEEKRVSLPKLRPPYAQIPSSASTKLKTVYEALASQQSLMTEELYESSSESSSPFRSLEGKYQRTPVVFSLKTTFKLISS